MPLVKLEGCKVNEMWQGERTCKLLGSCCDAVQVCVLLGCDATSLCDWSKRPIHWTLIYEVETTTLS
jgi:hypothetical protein